MKACKVNTRLGNKRNQSRDKIQWFEYDMGRAIAPGRFQLVAYPAVCYIIGVVDALDDIAFCVPRNVQKGQIRDVVYLWLKNNPARRASTAVSLIKVALQESWPCP